MRILMRNTVFKTAALAGLFSCMLALVGAFSGITASVHAVHADDVDTEAELIEFVKEAVDEYYIKFLMQGEEEHCNFGDLLPEDLPIPLDTALSLIVPGIGITDLSPESIRMLSTDEVKQLISILNNIGDHPTFGPIVQNLFPGGIDIWGACTLPQPDSTFRDVFTEEEENWRSGPIYLFVMNDEGKMLFNGADPSVEGAILVAEDEGNRNVIQSIIDEAETPSNAGIVDYCWNNPDEDGDEILDSNGNPIEGKAPGDSWKRSYVVDSFEYLGIDQPSGSRDIIFGSGLYPDPETGNAPSGCDGNGMADYDGDGMDGDGDGMDGDGDGMDGDGDDIVDTVKGGAESGGGCAIAAGSDSTPRSNAFNLLLIVSALFLTISFRSRAMDKRNGVRS